MHSASGSTAGGAAHTCLPSSLEMASAEERHLTTLAFCGDPASFLQLGTALKGLFQLQDSPEG